MIGRRQALAAAAALGYGAAARAASDADTGALHALLVGINDYRHKPLHGCVNDAERLAGTLRPIAASVTLLRDAEADRAGLLRAWGAVTARCQPGDTFFFAFAGHGSRQPEAVPFSEKDRLDDFLVLSGYDDEIRRSEQLIDNEIALMLTALGDRRVAVIFVADCCYSGTMTRSADPASAQQRPIRALPGASLVKALATRPRNAPPPPPPPPLDHVHFFAAGLESQRVTEQQFEGRPCGALSVAIATGLAGAADLDGDGRITVQELADHVLCSVRAMAQGTQTPEVTLGATAPSVLRVLPAALAKSLPAPTPSPAPRPVRLAIDGTPPPNLPLMSGVEQVPPGAGFDLLWRPATREAISALGDVIADRIGPSLLPAAVARVQAVKRLQEMVTQHALDCRVELAQPPVGRGIKLGWVNNAAHPRGTRLMIVVEHATLPGLVLFNLAGDGTVQLLYPDPERVVERPVAPESGRLALLLEVKPPFGTDHPVAVAAEGSLGPLVQELRQLDGTRQPMAAVEAIDRGLAGRRWQLGLATLVSRES